MKFPKTYQSKGALIKRPSSILLAFSLGAILLFLSGCDFLERKGGDSAPKRGASFKLKLADSEMLFFDQEDPYLRIKEGENRADKVVLLAIVGASCKPCRGQIPHLSNLQKNHGANLETIALFVDEGRSRAEIEKVAESLEIGFKVAFPEGNLEITQRLLGSRELPVMILYDRKGRYFTHYLGAIPEEMIDFDIRRALKKDE